MSTYLNDPPGINNSVDERRFPTEIRVSLGGSRRGTLTQTEGRETSTAENQFASKDSSKSELRDLLKGSRLKPRVLPGLNEFRLSRNQSLEENISEIYRQTI